MQRHSRDLILVQRTPECGPHPIDAGTAEMMNHARNQFFDFIGDQEPASFFYDCKHEHLEPLDENRLVCPDCRLIFQKDLIEEGSSFWNMKEAENIVAQAADLCLWSFHDSSFANLLQRVRWWCNQNAWSNGFYFIYSGNYKLLAMPNELEWHCCHIYPTITTTPSNISSIATEGASAVCKDCGHVMNLRYITVDQLKTAIQSLISMSHFIVMNAPAYFPGTSPERLRNYCYIPAIHCMIEFLLPWYDIINMHV